MKINIFSKIIIIFIFMFIVQITLNSSFAATIQTGIEYFPDSYKPYLLELQAKYPNWTFSALNTGLDYNTVVKNEGILSGSKTKSLSPKYYDDAWLHLFSTKEDTSTKWLSYKSKWLYQHESGWVTSSSDSVNYSLDPRNFLNEKYIFQFLNLGYNSQIHNKAGVEQILYGTEMYNTKVSYYNSEGTKIDTDKYYSELFIDAAIATQVSPYYLASKTKTESGCKVSTYGPISGKSTTYPGIYNYFNIRAYGDNPQLNGLKYASEKSWNTPAIAVLKGAEFISGSFISKGQNTLYLERFNVNPDANYSAYTHQYATDVEYAYKQALIMYKAYYNISILDKPHNFVIPVFNNMPSTALDIWTQEEGKFIAETKVVKASTSVSLLSRPSGVTSFGKSTVLKTVPSGTNMTVMYTGVNSTYDKVRLESGLEGYVFQSYIDYSFIEDSTRMIVDSSSGLRLRSGPGTNYSTVIVLANNTVVKRIQKGEQISQIWDKVVTASGTVGYVCRQEGSDIYLKEYSYTKVTNVTLNSIETSIAVDSTFNILATITPSSASYKDVIYTSSDSSVATVSLAGVVTAVSEGVTEIVVKTDDQNKTATCVVTVTEKVPYINFEKDNYNVGIGKEITPVVQITEGKTYTMSIEDSSVASLENGKIKGLKEGTTRINIQMDEEAYENFATIVVADEYYEIDSSILKTNQTLTKIDPETKVSSIKNKITLTNTSLRIKNISNTILVDTANVGTGTKIEILGLDEQVISEYTIVIYGDVNGDSKISASDYVNIKNHIMSVSVLSDIQKSGADTNKDGKVSASDYVNIKNYIMVDKSIIVQ